MAGAIKGVVGEFENRNRQSDALAGHQRYEQQGPYHWSKRVQVTETDLALGDCQILRIDC